MSSDAERLLPLRARGRGNGSCADDRDNTDAYNSGHGSNILMRHAFKNWMLCAVVSVWVTVASSLTAQVARMQCGKTRTLGLVLPGGVSDDDWRARHMRDSMPYPMMRRQTEDARRTLAASPHSASAFGVAMLAPEVLLANQTAYSLPDNDGAMWAGRGATWSVTAGAAICGRDGRWGAFVAPTLWRSANRDTRLVSDPEVVPDFWTGASVPWASPYHWPGRSLDRPRRFGDERLTTVDVGVLAAWFRTPSQRVEGGITTEPEWWGPGLRNALLLSTQSAGVPRAYVRTGRPLRLKGTIEAQLFVGRLDWSDYFRSAPPSDTARTLAGAAIVWRPWFESQLQLGISRLVAREVLKGPEMIRRFTDVFTSVGTPNAVPVADRNDRPGADQLFSVFAHYRLPDDGTEAWIEWARAQQPVSFADLLQEPAHSRAFTFGLQHVRALPKSGWHVRAAVEMSSTNQTGSFNRRPSGSFYTSRSVLGGFTQRGQVLGAVIGPGSVTQWAALDVAGPAFSAGVFVQRTKWDDDSFYVIPRPVGNGLCKHDVSMAYGTRGVWTTPWLGQLEAALSAQWRQNVNFAVSASPTKFVIRTLEIPR
jgi:hypothetical protein